MPIYVDVIAKLDERAAKTAANQIEREFQQAGKRAGDTFSSSMNSSMSGIDRATRQVGAQMVAGFATQGRTAARGFGSSFGSELAASLPGVGRFTSAMSGYESAAGKAGALAGRALGTAFQAAALGIIGAAGVALFKGFERYKSLDATAQRLGGLGKSGEEVKSIMADINSVVEGTPIALDAAAKSATQFLTGGVREGRPLQAALSAIADAAGASGARFEDIGLIFNQVFNKGKLQAEEMMQLNERGLNVQAALREEYGLSGAELEKMSKDGQISFGMLVQAIDGSFSGMSKRLANTVDGALSQLNTSVARTGANFISAIFGDPLSTTEGPGAMAEAINNVSAKIDSLNAWVTAHQDDIKRYFDQAVEAVEKLFDALGWVMDRINDIPGGVGTVVGAFAAWKALTIGQGAVAALSTALTGVNTMLGKTLPASAAAGASKIMAALGPVAALLASFEAVDWRDRLNPEDSRNIQNRAERGDWGSVLLGDAWPWLREQLGLDQSSSEVSGGGGSFAEPGNGMPPAPGYGLHWEDGRGWVPDSEQAPEPSGGPLEALFPGATGADAAGSGSGPKLPDAPVVPFSGDPMSLLQGFPVTSSLYSAASSVLDAQHSVAEKRARLAQLEQSGVATEQDILKARNDVIEAEGNQQQAELRLNEAKQSATEKHTKTMEGAAADLGQIGANLDKDFGISKGLAGIAENITKFVANLAAAPLLGQLGAVSALSPTQGGHGLMGILGARGVFGPQYMNNQYAEDSTSSSGPSASIPGGNPNVNAMLALAQSASGRTAYAPASDLVNGLADCSGSISDLVEMLQTGKTSPGRLFTTTNFASDAEAAKLGFRPGFMPGALNVGVNPYPGQSGHMAATLPNGVNFEGGGGTGGGAQYGGNAAGALDPQFEKQYYLPVGGATGIPTATSATAPVAGPVGAPAAPSGPGFPIPLPVTIVGGMPGVAPLGLPAPGVGFGPAPGPVGPTGVPSIAGGPMSHGVGMPQAAPFGAPGVGPAPGPTAIGGGSGLSGSGKGGIGMSSGGTLDLAMQAGGMALDVMAPGAGQVAQTGMKLANRAIEYGGQVAGIITQGWIDTLVPFGGSQLASNNWLTRIVGGLAGAAPALPNMAGKAAGALSKQQVDQNQQGQQPQVQRPGDINVEYHNHQATEDRAGADLTHHLGNMNAAPGM